MKGYDMNNFECKYKFELTDSIFGAKQVYKSQKRTQDKIIAVLIPILFALMLAMLIYDVVKKRSVIWDSILLVALFVLELMYVLIPVMLVNSQKKSFKKQKLDEMDHLLIKIEDNICTETMFKSGAEVAKNVHNLKTLTSYIEDNDRLVLVFNKIEFVVIRKANLNGDLNKLKNYLNKCMLKTSKKK